MIVTVRLLDAADLSPYRRHGRIRAELASRPRMVTMHEWLLARFSREYGPGFRPFVATAHDGVTIHGVHWPQRGDPLVVFCHGLFATKNQLPVYRFVTRVAEDFDTVVFDFRGHGASEGVSTLGGDEVGDLRAVVEYARREGYRTIVAVGASMGGATALRYFGRYGDLGGIVTIGAFTDVSQLRRLVSRLGLRLLFGTPAARPLVRIATGVRMGELRANQQPLRTARHVSVPLLVIHGAWDHLVEPRHARELFASAAGPKQLVVIRRIGHVNTFLNGETHRRIAAWMRQQVTPTQNGVDPTSSR